MAHVLETQTALPQQAVPTVSQALARHVSATGFEALPAEAVAAAKRLILDTMAVAWAGSNATGIEAVKNTLASSGQARGGPACTLWGTDDTAPMQEAAFLNSAAAAALDFDSLHLGALMHSQVVTLPALWALAEHFHLSGKQLLTALVLADDINCRLGLSAQGHDGWFFTSIFGVFGAASASAKLLGLGEAGIAHALGTALFQVSGTQQSMQEKSLTKRFMAAFAAKGGLFCALLARAGVAAPAMPFEGKFGLFNLYQQCDPAVVLDGLGTRYENSRITIKKYPSCGCSHALTEAALLLVERHDIRPGDVARIRVRISEFMNRMVGGEFDPHRNGAQVTGQFSAQYAVACVLFRRRFVLEDIQPANVTDQKVADCARSVRVEIDPDNTGQITPAEVIFEMRSGRILSEKVESFPGGTSGQIAQSTLHDKVRDCMRQGVLPWNRDRIGHFIGRVERLEDVDDMAGLFKDL